MRCTSQIVFACQSKACAPPPVGTGGSNPSKGHEPIEVKGSSFDEIDKALGIVPWSERKRDKWGRSIPEPTDGKYVYRVVSEADYQRMKRQGFLDTDGRGNVDPDEGLVTNADDVAWSYLGDISRKGAADNPTGTGRVLKIRREESDGWSEDRRDGYIKTKSKVPFDRVEMISHPIKVTRTVETRPGFSSTQIHYEFGFEWLSCKSKACAPPPVGSGGSTPAATSQAADAARRQSMKRLSSLWDSDIEAAGALSFYIGSAYIEVNGQLRGHYAPNKSVTELIEKMDRAFKGASVTLPAPGTVYRKVEITAEMRQQLRAGSSFVDKGFTSTSTDEGTAADFGSGRGALLRITLPKGTRVMSGNDVESELILNRGTKFKVTGSRIDRKLGMEVFDVEVVP